MNSTSALREAPVIRRQLLRGLLGLLACITGTFLLAGCGREPIEHGTTFILGVATNVTGVDPQQAIWRGQQVLTKRLDALKIACHTDPIGDGKLSVEVATGTNDLGMIRRVLRSQGSFEVHLVHPDSAELTRTGKSVPDYEVRPYLQRSPTGSIFTIPFLIKTKPEKDLTGQFIKETYSSPQPVTGQSDLTIRLDSEGRKRLEEITRQYLPAGGKHYMLAIVINGAIISTPSIVAPIEDGKIPFDLAFAPSDAAALAAALMNPMDTPLRILEEKTF